MIEQSNKHSLFLSTVCFFLSCPFVWNFRATNKIFFKAPSNQPPQKGSILGGSPHRTRRRKQRLGRAEAAALEASPLRAVDWQPGQGVAGDGLRCGWVDEPYFSPWFFKVGHLEGVKSHRNWGDETDDHHGSKKHLNYKSWRWSKWSFLWLGSAKGFSRKNVATKRERFLNKWPYGYHICMRFPQESHDSNRIYIPWNIEWMLEDVSHGKM